MSDAYSMQSGGLNEKVLESTETVILEITAVERAMLGHLLTLNHALLNDLEGLSMTCMQASTQIWKALPQSRRDYFQAWHKDTIDILLTRWKDEVQRVPIQSEPLRPDPEEN